MNKPVFNFKIFLVAIVACLVITSCSDDENTSVTEAIDQSDVQRALKIDEISNFIDGMTLNNLPSRKNSLQAKSNDCISFTAAADGYTLTFDNCVFGDDEVVNGTIRVGYEIVDGTVTSTITFTDLSYGGNKINGSKTSSYSLDTAGGSFSYTVTSDLALELADGTLATEKGTKTYEISGLGTGEASYSITGSWEVTYGDESYMLSTEPSISGDFMCEYITKGILKITENGISVSVDFGDGTCDNKAIATYPDGTSVEFEL